MNHTCLCLPSRSWSSFTDPGRMEGWVSQKWASSLPRTATWRISWLLTVQTVMPYRASERTQLTPAATRSAGPSVELMTSWGVTNDSNHCVTESPIFETYKIVIFLLILINISHLTTFSDVLAVTNCYIFVKLTSTLRKMSPWKAVSCDGCDSTGRLYPRLCLRHLDSPVGSRLHRCSTV